MQVFNARRAVSALLISTFAMTVTTTAGLTAPAKKDAAEKPADDGSAAMIKKAYQDMTTGNWAFAVSELCTLLRTQRNNALARRYLCYSLLQAGAPRDAITQLDALSQMSTAIPFDLCMRGDALMQLGEGDKAIEALRAAMAMDQKSDYIRGKLIEALQTYGKFQEASAYCAEGYYAAKGPLKDHYLEVFNTLQQQRALLAQRNLGIQIAATASYPMMPPQSITQSLTASKTGTAPGAVASTVTTTTTTTTTTSTTTAAGKGAADKVEETDSDDDYAKATANLTPPPALK